MGVADKGKLLELLQERAAVEPFYRLMRNRTISEYILCSTCYLPVRLAGSVVCH